MSPEHLRLRTALIKLSIHINYTLKNTVMKGTSDVIPATLYHINNDLSLQKCVNIQQKNFILRTALIKLSIHVNYTLKNTVMKGTSDVIPATLYHINNDLSLQNCVNIQQNNFTKRSCLSLIKALWFTSTRHTHLDIPLKLGRPGQKKMEKEKTLKFVRR